MRPVFNMFMKNKIALFRFDELKLYQTGSLLVSLNNAEKTYFNWKDKHVEFSNILQMILEKENYSNQLNEGISKRKNELNIESKATCIKKIRRMVLMNSIIHI